MVKDVHTEHCCAIHGCKYGEEDVCTVWLGYAPQSYGHWDGHESQPIPSVSKEEFELRRNKLDPVYDR